MTDISPLPKLALIAAAALLIYYFLPRRLQNYWLLAASYFFHATWIWTFPLALMLLTALNYVFAHEIKAALRHRRLLLGIGILLNVLALGLVKYADPLIGVMPARLLSGLATFGLPTQRDLLIILFPVGLSFRILEGISYLVDVYNDRTLPATDLVDFALYFAYFPKLLAGPIERAREFLPQLRANRVVDNAAIAQSATLLIVGILRKVVFADSLRALIPTDLLSQPQSYPASVLLMGLVAYGIALYNDFAGYSDIARGISLLFGIRLIRNFEQPYFARNFSEFWGRWHISLSHWLRDYVYFPISRALARRIPDRSHPIHLIVPPLVTMVVSALWHQASLPMLIWGLLYAVYMIVWRIPGFLGRPNVPPDNQPRWMQVLQWFAVFILVMLAWVPFQTGVTPTLQYWRGLLVWNSPQTFDPRVLILVGMSFALDWIQRRDEMTPLRWPLPVRATALASVLFLLLMAFLANTAATSFIYQGF